MKQFLAIYLGSPASNANAKATWDKLDPAVRQQKEEAGMKAWGDWMDTHKDAIVVIGGPLGKTQRASRSGIEATMNEMAGYVVVQAESHDAAAKMFKDHPHFAIFPGEAVEIMECLPVPGM